MPKLPELLVVEAHPQEYRAVSSALMALLNNYSPDVIPLSIDEAVVDLAFTPSMTRDRTDLGAEIKARLRSEVGDWLTCSIGFAPNSFLAKIAAGLTKPDGLEVIDSTNLVEVFSRIALTDLTGIAQATAAKLRANSIWTPLDFLAASQQTLRHQVFGSIVGEAWYLRLRGYEIDFHTHATKSISHSHVLPTPTQEPDELAALVVRLSDKLGRRLRKLDLAATKLELVLRTEGGVSHHTYSHHPRLYASSDIAVAARVLLARLAPSEPVRFLALNLTRLSSASTTQLDFFTPDQPRSERVATLIDQLRDRFGEDVIIPARLLDHKNLAPDRIAFGRLPRSR
jgi:DNA polymerase-4